jgi:hypothetical protein
VGLQEPELEDLEGVDRRIVVDDVHHLPQGSLRKSGDQQVEHHSLAGGVAGPKFGFRESKPSGRLKDPKGRQVQLAGVRRGGWYRRRRLLLGTKPDFVDDVGQPVVQAVEPLLAEDSPDRHDAAPLLVAVVLHVEVEGCIGFVIFSLGITTEDRKPASVCVKNIFNPHTSTAKTRLIKRVTNILCFLHSEFGEFTACKLLV